MQRLAASFLAALVVVLIGAPSSQAAEPIRYVALGDSYSAASGVLPPDPEAPLNCLRSTSNYPHLVAAATGAELTDVTCGGADTSDYFTPQYDNVPPQLDAVTADTELVTMTIGGNDSGVFINSIVQCAIAGASTLGQGSPCKDRYGSSFEDTVRNTTYPSLVDALTAVQAAAPDARGRHPELPVDPADVRWLLRQDAGRRGRRAVPAEPPDDPERRRPPRGRGHRAPPTWT